jgi:hypothetical protein
MDPYAPRELPQAPQMPPPPEEFARPAAVEERPPALPNEGNVGMSQEEMKANLQQMLSELMAKYGDYNAQHFAVANKIQEGDGQMLGDLFDFFTKIGVDPSSPEEVGSYLQKLRSVSPELADQLETLLKRVLMKNEGGDTGDESEQPMEASTETPQSEQQELG